MKAFLFAACRDDREIPCPVSGRERLVKAIGTAPAEERQVSRAW
jgi:hypothetical protein